MYQEIYNNSGRRYWKRLDGELKAWAAEIGLDYVTNDDSMSRPFEAPPFIVNFFYRSGIKKSARKGGERHA
ncbi:MAG: radical SAM protein [Oscillibacter sp.]|nr:radical SAM protein [Oscillibacter sp.]